MNAFITGTDTSVGKTFATGLLLRHLRARGADCVGFKPICCGSRDDAEKLHLASGGDATGLSLNEVNPVWLRTPAAPYTAAMIEGRTVDLAAAREAFARLRERHRDGVLVEGVGGWLVPITRDFTVADLAVELALPVIVVVKNRLGALNHTALTVRDIQRRGLQCAGLIFNDGPDPLPDLNAPVEEQAKAEAEVIAAETIARASNPGVCEETLGVPILAALAAHQTAWPQP